MSESARVLGFETDRQRYTEYKEGARKAYNYPFVRDSTIDTDRQAKLVRLLAPGLLKGEAKAAV